ncbi:hypothetical protein [Nocardia cyriacigeorgica]|uniref:hypothetical protein n=1 Tax=Nocardia cyriacigeorgica TaxID=135487 RepID=UPI002454C110|nr:hypothetical protein [Nocardia cyriacigeorgica]
MHHFCIECSGSCTARSADGAAAAAYGGGGTTTADAGPTSLSLAIAAGQIL